MKTKTEDLYAIVLMKIREIIPEFSPKIAVSDFERAPRKVFSHHFPEINIIGCWFHFTQAIWRKSQLLGLALRYKTDQVFANWLRKLMALPLLPESEILGAFYLLEKEMFYHNEIEDQLIKKLEVCYKKTWIIGQQGLSVFSAENATNDGAEAFHKTLKSVITVHHPNIWKFLSDLNKVILNFELESQRLEQGLEITRKPKRQTSENATRRNKCKHALGQFEDINTEIADESNCDDGDDGDDTFYNTCIICCQPKQGTYALIPCGHANLCRDCGRHFIEENMSCPICRTEINHLMQIFQ